MSAFDHVMAPPPPPAVPVVRVNHQAGQVISDAEWEAGDWAEATELRHPANERRYIKIEKIP